MIARHSARARAVLSHVVPPSRGSAGRLPSRPAPKSHRLVLANQTRSFSLWPSSNPKTPAADVAEQTSVFPPEPAHGGTVTAQPSSFEPVVPVEPISSALNAPVTEAASNNWTLASQILAENGCGKGIWVGKLQTLLEYLHLQTGWPMYATIIVFAIITRLSFFPLLGRSIANNRRLAAISPVMQPILQRQLEARRTGDMQKLQQAFTEVRKLWADNNCNPARALVMPLAAIPIGFGSFFALRGMAQNAVPGFTEGGTLWFQDLTLPDPYYILPITSALTQIISLRLGIETGQDPATQTPQQAQVKTFLQGLMLVSIPFTSFMPVAMLVYWNSSNLTALITSQLFRFNSVKNAFGIPEPTVAAQPQRPPSFYDNVLRNMAPPAGQTYAQPGQPSYTVQPRAQPAQDPSQLRESLYSGNVTVDAGKPLQKRHRGRIEDFGNEFADHMRQTGGNPWPLPPGLSNSPPPQQPVPNNTVQVEAARSGVAQVESQGQGPRGGGPSHSPQNNPPPKSRGFSTSAIAFGSSYTQRYRTPSATPTFYNSEAEVAAAREALTAGLRETTLEQRMDALQQAQQAAQERAKLRSKLLTGCVRHLQKSFGVNDQVAELEASASAYLKSQDAPAELTAEILPVVRRKHLLRAGRAGATTTLEFSSAQMAGQSVAKLGATVDEVRMAVDTAAMAAARQKSDAFERGIKRDRYYSGAVNWSPLPPSRRSLEQRLYQKALRIRAKRFRQEKLGRWKRIIGWRVGAWDRTAANELSHQRRWARGSLEEWQDRKRQKRDAQQKRVAGWRRFEAYRKEM